MTSRNCWLAFYLTGDDRSVYRAGAGETIQSQNSEKVAPVDRILSQNCTNPFPGPGGPLRRCVSPFFEGIKLA